jgi:putative thioredoxin
LLATIEMNELAGPELDVESLRMEIASAPENYEARRQLSTLLFLEADIDGAMSEALEIVKGGREKDRDSGREALLKMFEALGNSNEHVVRYRRLLAQALN